MVPKVLEQGADGNVVVTTLQERKFPARYVKAWLRISGDGFLSWRRLLCEAISGSRYEIAANTSRTGVTCYAIKRVWTVSLIGLFSIPVNVHCKASMIVLPAPIKPPNTITLPRGIILRPKPGGGFSEDYDMRPYRHGDQIRSIHWKISAKLDSLIIREPLVPPAHSRLIQTVQWDGARERDLILGRLRWVSDYLLKWELPYFMKLGKDGPVAEITKAGDLVDYLYHVLDNEAHKIPKPVSLPSRFEWVMKVDAKGDGDLPPDNANKKQVNIATM